MGGKNHAIRNAFERAQPAPPGHQEKEAEVDERAELRNVVAHVRRRLRTQVAQDQEEDHEDASLDSDEGKKIHNLAGSDSDTDEDSGEEEVIANEELEIEPQAKKPPTGKRRVSSETQKGPTKQASSTTITKTPRNKNRSKKGKTATVTPKTVTIQPKEANISPVTDEFINSKEQRRTASVSSMGSNAARKSSEKHKRKAAELKADNDEKEAKINELANNEKDAQEANCCSSGATAASF